jgi:hypothetical protein
MLLTLGLQSFDFASQGSLGSFRTLLRGGQSDVQWSVARYLQSMEIRPGDKVAVLGFSFGAYWARLAKVHIAAEVPSCRVDLEVCGTGNPPDPVFDFWAADDPVRHQVLAALEKTGAKLVVTNLDDLRPQGIGRRALIGPIPTREWRRIPETDYYVYVFPHPLTSAR